MKPGLYRARARHLEARRDHMAEAEAAAVGGAVDGVALAVLVDEVQERLRVIHASDDVAQIFEEPSA